MAAAILWIMAISIEYPLHLQPPGSGTIYDLNQVMFLVAISGFVIGILGLMWSQAAGQGWFGKLALGLFALGWILIAIATLLSLFTGSNDSLLFPLGGLAASLGCLLSGIAIATANRWQGWQRWSVLIYAIYYWAALFLPLVIANREPNQVTETIWGLAWLLVGLALYTYNRRPAALAV
ncbi:MAG: hypothetical protein ACK2UW_08185 [Anaerolineales bacterium]|jgi:hypothetical protein